MSPNRRNRLVGGLSIAVIGASVWTGLSARAASASLAARRAQWETASQRIEVIRHQYQPLDRAESAAFTAASVERAALAVPPADRSLADSLVRLAAAAGLAEVRVERVAGPSSSPVSPVLAAAAVRSAPYSMVVDFSGGFAGAVKFVSSVPSSVSLSRFSGVRGPARGHYQVIFSVHELDVIPGH